MGAGGFQAELDFEAAQAAHVAGDALVVDLDGFEGPLDLLLTLARQQKVDLLNLSISALADQYLAFIRVASKRNFALAADYLVMAAWLTYLKSRLLLPKPELAANDDDAPEGIAAALAFRLAKLDAMRHAVGALQALPQEGRERFTRGDPEAIEVQSSSRLDVDLYALISAYIGQQTRQSRREYRPELRSQAYPLQMARDRLKALGPTLTRWTSLAGLAPRAQAGGPSRASHLASTLSAGLELVKEGDLEVRQLEAFADLYIRKRSPTPTEDAIESADQRF